MIKCTARKLFYLLLYPSYEQEAPESFHVSMACVEPQSASGGATSIYLIRDNGDPEEREVLVGPPLQ